MKICIFGAASAHIDTVYIKAVEELSEKLAKRGHTLVFGAGGTGLMGTKPPPLLKPRAAAPDRKSVV